jgi:pimeloyl-ACP methyl ester carboxylesterase
MIALRPDWAENGFSRNDANVDGRSIPYLVGGQGHPLLLLHGLAASFDWWQYNAPALARQFTVYLTDLPGFDRLARVSAPDTMRGYTMWLRKFLDAVGLEQCHVLGISMGAEIALRLAADSPDRVDRLVLVTPSAMLTGDSPIRHTITGIRVLTELPGALIPLAIVNGLKQNPLNFWRASRAMVASDVRSLLPGIRAETLILASINDPVLPQERAAIYFDMIPNARLAFFPAARHLIMLNDPNRFNRVVAQFLTNGSVDTAPTE